VCWIVITYTFAGADFDDFQGASEAAISAWILPEQATRKILKILPAQRVALKKGLAAALRLGYRPIGACALAAPCRQPIFNATNV
jgi:hypothetical protein